MWYHTATSWARHDDRSRNNKPKQLIAKSASCRASGTAARASAGSNVFYKRFLRIT
jgi:hypothetical protein